MLNATIFNDALFERLLFTITSLFYSQNMFDSAVEVEKSLCNFLKRPFLEIKLGRLFL